MKTSSSEFEALVLHELSRAWGRNVGAFKWVMSGIQPPAFTIFDNKDRWGQWDTKSRQMSFSRDLITNRSWNEVLEVLKHEMVHQYVSEVLHMDNEDPHGPTFMSVCKQHNIDAAVRGTPGANKVSTTNHIVEKVRHLLSLATNDGATEEEAKTAAELAHNMMLKYNITLQEKNEEKGYTVRYLGGHTGRIQGYMSELSTLLSKYYFVEIIWVSFLDPRTKKFGRELEISGTEDNVEAAEYVHDFITRSALIAWDIKFKSQEFKDEMNYDLSLGRYGAPESKRGYTISARYNFLLGFIRGFRSQLKQAEVKEISVGLVLAKDPALEAFYKTRHPSIRNLKGGGGYQNSTWQNAGYSEGSKVKLPAAVKVGKSTPLLNK